MTDLIVGRVASIDAANATAQVELRHATPAATVPWHGPPPSDGQLVLVAQDQGAVVVLPGGDPGTTGAWTPTLTASTTDPTLGSGATRHGRVARLGRLVMVTATVIFGSSGVSAGAGTYRLSYPSDTEPDATWQPGRGRILGTWRAFDDSAAAHRFGVWVWAATGYGILYAPDGSLVTATSPWTWAASDELHVSGWWVS